MRARRTRVIRKFSPVRSGPCFSQTHIVAVTKVSGVVSMTVITRFMQF